MKNQTTQYRLKCEGIGSIPTVYSQPDTLEQVQQALKLIRASCSPEFAARFSAAKV